MLFRTIIFVGFVGLSAAGEFGSKLERQQQIQSLEEQLQNLQQQIQDQAQQTQQGAQTAVLPTIGDQQQGQNIQQTIQRLEQQLQAIQQQQQQQPPQSLPVQTIQIPVPQLPQAVPVPVPQPVIVPGPQQPQAQPAMIPSMINNNQQTSQQQQQSPMNILEQMMDQINIQASAEATTNPNSPSTPSGMTQFLRNIVMFFMRFMQNFMNLAAQNPRIIVEASAKGVPEEARRIIDSITTGIVNNSFDAGMRKFKSNYNDLKVRQKRNTVDDIQSSKPENIPNIVQDWGAKIVDTLVKQFLSGDIQFKKAQKL